MAVKNSFVTLSEQITKLNKNAVEVLAGLDEVTSSNDESVDVSIIGENGQQQTRSFPTVGFLQSEIQRLNNMLNSLAGLDARGAVVQPSDNQFQRIIVSDMNKEPNPIGNLNSISNFHADENWFFDSLLNPLLNVEIDLNDKVENNVREIISRRYRINIEKDRSGNPTGTGQSAIDSFNENFKNRTDIEIEELEEWMQSTPGIVPLKDGSLINFDEQHFELETNKIRFDGLFTVLSVDEDKVNNRIFYNFDTLDYFEIETGQQRTLTIGDELIINEEKSFTRFKITNISRATSQLRLQLETVEGFQPVPVGIQGGMKIFSPVNTNKKVRISVGFNEYNVIFVKAINDHNYIEGRKWSRGSAFYTNDLRLNAPGTQDDGKTMNNFYLDAVFDYGRLLRDLVQRKIPSNLAIQPNAPVLEAENFEITQVNEHITNTPNLEQNRQLFDSSNSLRSEINELNDAIKEKSQELSIRNFENSTERRNEELILNNMIERLESKSSQLSSTVNTILANERRDLTPDPEFRVRGFWNFPSPQSNNMTRPQEGIQFRIQYRYTNPEGQEPPNQTFRIEQDDGTIQTASFSNWKEIKTNIRKRIFDTNTQKWLWSEEDISDPEVNNSNSLDLPIQPGERIEIRVKTISEAGWPDNIIESEWSNILELTFPDELVPTRDLNDRITRQAELENVRVQVTQDLDSLGLRRHLNTSFSLNNTFYAHSSDQIAVTNDNGEISTLTQRLINLRNTTLDVEEFTNITLQNGWVNYGDNFAPARFYRHQNRVYLEGVIRVEDEIRQEVTGASFGASGFTTINFPNLPVRSGTPPFVGNNNQTANDEYAKIATLPNGYIPDTVKTFPVLTSLTGGDEEAGIGQSFDEASYPWGDNQNNNLNVMTGQLEINPNGDIFLRRGSTGYLSLEGISFRVPSSNNLSRLNNDFLNQNQFAG